MRVITVFTFVLVAFVVSSSAKPELSRLKIKVLESNGVDQILNNIIEATKYAFDLGSSADGRMKLLESRLKTTIAGYNWFLAEGADGVAHSSEVYAYLKVTSFLFPHTVHIIATSP
ncbi:uncharacterized protein [Onthophagus taurus]|uniref:uncharacterized protein n=1 Tax=Onthophagus taurus TaxID=166361 RepID=UPI0039BDF318